MAQQNMTVWKVVTGAGIVLGIINVIRSDRPGPARTLGIVLLVVSVCCCLALVLGVGSPKEPDKIENEPEGDPPTPKPGQNREW